MKKINTLTFEEITASDANSVPDSIADIYKVHMPASVENEITMQKKGFFLPTEL